MPQIFTGTTGASCHCTSPSPSFQQEALRLSHDVPTAGHQGVDKTLEKLCRIAYWVNMAHGVEQYCRSCAICQQSKLSMPPWSPPQTIPIGQPWQMVAVDVSQVPLSTNNNRYLLVFQDYFTKWADAVPLPDQTANLIVTALIRFFAHMVHHKYFIPTKGKILRALFSPCTFRISLYSSVQ